MIERACNKFVLILRDKTESEISGLEIPNEGRVKPHSGIIHAAGSLVEDENIKASIGKKCLFHQGTGFEIEYEEIQYLVLGGHEIIALP
jgi:co-chaperonin GroES (HSP10)